MLSQLQSADVYTDFKGLNDLKVAARAKTPEALEKVAGQFEAMMLQMVMKSVREADFGDSLFGSNAEDTYRGMYDQQLTLELSKGRGLGLRALLVKQLAGHVGVSQEEAPAPLQAIDRTPPARGTFNAVMPKSDAMTNPAPSPVTRVAPTTAPATAPQAAAVAQRDPASFDTPELFVKTLWPLAKQHADKLGVAPEVLVAQAALETGWGKAVLKRADESSSYNLFNIKAHGGWQGDSVSKTALEFRAGVAVREQSSFRAYDSYAESFADYVEFIQDNPRYHNALKNAGDAQRYLRELQDAGYATDPGYADKIQQIMSRDTFQSALAPLKSDAEASIT